MLLDGLKPILRFLINCVILSKFTKPQGFAMSFTNKILLASVFFVTLKPAFAIEINGDYANSGNGLTTLRIISLDTKGGNTITAAAQISTTTDSGCSGDVSGVGKVVGNTFKFNSYTTIDSTCTVSVKFNKDGSTGTISEKGCSGWHGMQCAFEGSVSRQ